MSVRKNNEWLRGAQQFMGDDFFQDFREIIMEGGPSVNLYTSETEVLCVAFLPASQKPDVEIFVDTNTMTLQGSLNIAFEGYELIHQETFHGPFKRKVELPHPVAPHPIQAFYKKGLLFIRLRKIYKAEEAAQKVNFVDLDHP